MRKSVILLVALIATTALAQTITPIDGDDAVLKAYTTSWIANDGGWEESHIPHTMLNMYVSPDGTAATVCNWDEGGTNVAVFRDGKLLSRPEGSGTGGWGRFSFLGVVLDDKYVYHLLSQHGCDGGNNEMNVNGLRQYPPCDEGKEWKTIRRYDLLTGLGAPFKGGYGYRGDMLVVATERFRSLEGLATSAGRLYVAIGGGKEHQLPDSIKIYDKATMKYIKGYPVKGGLGQIYADGKGCLWMYQGRRLIRFEANTGKLKPQYVDLPAGVEANTCCIDVERKRLLIPNHGRDMNILIYTDIYTKPRQSGTFGSTGGVFVRTGEYMQGEVGPMRFTGPRAVGVDGKGNIYIANTAVSGGQGAVIEVYREKDGQLLWKQEGLVFTANADFDRDDSNLFYTPEKIHLINKNLTGQRVDKVIGYTADSFTFPTDERVNVIDGPFVTSCFMRQIEGQKFQLVSDMYGGMLAGYRFNYQKHGYIGIPSFTFSNGYKQIPSDKVVCWMDDNGDGHREEKEVRVWDGYNLYCMSYMMDEKGNVWRGVRERGFMYWHMEGLDKNGNPRFAEPRLLPLPQDFRDAKRIWYDAEHDELFMAGNSNVNPDKRDTWWSMCGTIVCCRNFLKRLNNGEIKEGWKSDLSIYIPFHVEDGKCLDHTNAKAFTVAGDYIFVILAREGWITVYDRQTGQFVGRLQPDDTVHRQSGWADFNYAINARRLPDGSYEILAEENAFAKVLYYRWNPQKE
jgi:hypothetical protein